MTIKEKARSWFPRSGSPYELFDSSVFLIVLGFIGYVLSRPTSTNTEALQGLFDVAGSPVWGTLLTLAGVFGAICSYSQRPEVLFRGMTMIMVVSTYWSAAILVGLVFFESPPRAIISVVIYGWIASRMYRERDRLAV